MSVKTTMGVKGEMALAWCIHAGGFSLGEPSQETGVVAVGTVTPVAQAGWIELRGGAPEGRSLEASARRAAALTEVLETLRGRYPGYRWFVREE